MRNESLEADAAWQDYREGRGPKPDTANSLGRHDRKCTICSHPERKAIEQEFLRWYAPQDIAMDHDIPCASAIYRHAHAKGLFERRRLNLRFALEPLIEQGNHVEVTAGSVIRAVRAYAHIDDRGAWISPAEKSLKDRLAQLQRRRAAGSRKPSGRKGKRRAPPRKS